MPCGDVVLQQVQVAVAVRPEEVPSAAGLEPQGEAEVRVTGVGVADDRFSRPFTGQQAGGADQAPGREGTEVRRSGGLGVVPGVDGHHGAALAVRAPDEDLLVQEAHPGATRITEALVH